MAVDIDNSIRHWRELAAQQQRLAKIERDRGSSDAPQQSRAKMFEATAKALELQRDTGILHCSCCLKPMAFHRTVKT